MAATRLTAPAGDIGIIHISRMHVMAFISGLDEQAGQYHAACHYFGADARWARDFIERLCRCDAISIHFLTISAEALTAASHRA